jgi:hypothetical protein
MNDDDYAELFKKLPGKSSSGTSWQDVAAEFENLSRTVADVVRTAWQRSGGEASVGQLREGLQSIVDDVNRTADGTPESRQARDQLVRLIESIREAAQRAGDEVRPELLSLLRQANAELRRLGQIDD